MDYWYNIIGRGGLLLFVRDALLSAHTLLKRVRDAIPFHLCFVDVISPVCFVLISAFAMFVLALFVVVLLDRHGGGTICQGGTPGQGCGNRG